MLHLLDIPVLSLSEDGFVFFPKLDGNGSKWCTYKWIISKATCQTDPYLAGWELDSDSPGLPSVHVD